MKRSSGVLLHISSLPSDYGIGTLGKEAYNFVDTLKKAGQSYWQILPIGPTSFGDSPYQSFSSYAGNPYFIDLDILVEEGLLIKKDLKEIKVVDENNVDYGYLYETRLNILYKAYLNGIQIDRNKLEQFIFDNPKLKDYAFFMALKENFGMVSWNEWPDNDIRKRRKEAIDKYSELLNERIEFYEYIQFLFFKQFYNLKKYMNDKGIKLIGDIPIYVSYDSCDCWMNPEYFELDEDLIPTSVAGCPPDYFTADGQLWGNPLYNYSKMKEDGYKWWIERIGINTKFFDVIRIDHFRGFESYWSVPYRDETARNGKWIKGPNMELLNIFKNWFYGTEFIVEDLGYHTPEVQKMLDDFGYPGMKVLEFGFDSREESNHAPEFCKENSICYVGTHDNSTIMGWLTAANKDDVKCALKYLNTRTTKDFNWKMIKVGMKTKSVIFVCQLQDYLGLDDSARMNTPGTFGNNWKWRMNKKSINNRLIKRIRNITIENERCY